MHIEYRSIYTEEHLIDSFLRYRKQIWWYKLVYKFKWLTSLLVGGLVVLWLINGLVLSAIVFGGILGVLLICWPINRWLIKHNFRKSPYFESNIVFKLNESGVFITETKGHSEMSWEVYTKARRFEDGLLLFQGPHFFNWLPDTALNNHSPSDACELVKKFVSDIAMYN